MNKHQIRGFAEHIAEFLAKEPVRQRACGRPISEFDAVKVWVSVEDSSCGYAKELEDEIRNLLRVPYFHQADFPPPGVIRAPTRTRQNCFSCYIVKECMKDVLGGVTNSFGSQPTN